MQALNTSMFNITTIQSRVGPTAKPQNYIWDNISTVDVHMNKMSKSVMLQVYVVTFTLQKACLQNKTKCKKICGILLKLSKNCLPKEQENLAC